MQSFELLSSPTEDTVRQLIKRGEHTKKHPGFRILLCFALFALFVGQGSAARIVRSGIWWWFVVLGGDNCHSGGAGSTLGLSVRRRGKHNLGLLYYCWAVFTFLKRWVYIDLDRMSFFKRYAITSFENGLQTLDWY